MALAASSEQILAELDEGRWPSEASLLLRCARLAKAVACLDEMKDAEHARGIVIGIKDLQTALRVFQWMRWTRQGVVQVGWWVAGAFVIWTQFEEPIREAVRVWLAGQ